MEELALDVDPIDEYPIDLDSLKADLRIAHADLDDRLLVYLAGAVSRAENFMNRAVAEREHRWTIDCFPYDGPEIVLPRGKVQSVESIVYSSGGVLTTLAGPTSAIPGTDYQEDLRGDRGRLMPPRGGAWPSVDVDVPSPITVTYVAGWSAEDVPSDILRAVVAGVSDALDLTGASLFTDGQRDIEFVEKLLSGWRIFE